ncbi:MAG: c-type cytochrome [Gemmatimonadales bacterium]
MTLARWWLTVDLLAAGLGFARPAVGQTAPSVDSAAERATRGRALFEGKGLCFSCHGKDGAGVLGPSTRLAGRALVHTKATLADVAALIKSGVDSAHSVSGQVMPPRGGSRLTDAQVDAVAQYVLELQRRNGPS